MGGFVSRFFFDNSLNFQYSSIEEAVAARDALHNTFWPHGNPKELKVDYSNESEVSVCYNICAHLR